MLPLKIAITGPESTGKSCLAAGLARHYRTVFVPEYARKYIEMLARPYVWGDILKIAMGQIASEQAMMKKTDSMLFCDTELIVTKIWSDVKFGKCDPWILGMIKENRYDLFLLCDIDLPWEEDPQREDPDRREFLFDLYTKELTGYGFPFFVISGSGDQRLQNAVKVIETFFSL